MPVRLHLRPAAGALAVAFLMLAGCSSSGGGDDGAAKADETESTAGDPTDTTSAPDTSGDEDEAVDTSGADEVAELTGAFLEELRVTIQEVGGTSSNARIQANTGTLSDLANDADAALREVEVGDPALAELVDDLLAALSDGITVFDEISAADTDALTPTDGDALSAAEVDVLNAAVAVQDVALVVADGGAAPDGPTLGEVLPVPEDFPIVSGIREPAYRMFPEGTVPTTESGPCGEPSASLVVPPRAYAGVLVEEPSVSGAARVLAFEDDDEASAYLDAFAVANDCSEPEGLEASSTAVDTGQRVDVVQVAGGVTSSFVAERVGSRVVVVIRTGDLISEGSDAAAITGEQVNGLVAVMVDKATA